MQKAVIPDLAFSTHLICVRTFWCWEVTKFNLILQPFRNEHFHGLQKKSYSSQMNCPQKFEEKTGKWNEHYDAQKLLIYTVSDFI